MGLISQEKMINRKHSKPHDYLQILSILPLYICIINTLGLDMALIHNYLYVTIQLHIFNKKKRNIFLNLEVDCKSNSKHGIER